MSPLPLAGVGSNSIQSFVPLPRHMFSSMNLHTPFARVTSAVVVLATTTLFALSSGTTCASPYVPASDLEALEQLSTRPGEAGRTTQSSRAMRTLLARDPKNVDLAVRIAQVYVSRARAESDPRFLGQAQAVLAPWWGLSEPPVPVLLLRATIRQSNHDFSNALRDLEQAVKREPGNAQAWLTLATVQQVSGNPAAALASCAKLVPITTRLVSTTCAASVDGAMGRAANAYAALDTAIGDASFVANRDVPVAVRTWAITLQAELAERLARPQEADRLYRASLALDPADAYTVAAYSDFLLDTGRPAEVLALIPAATRADILLLRRAIAARQAAVPEAATVADELGRRFAASRARGDRVHLREEARYTLIFKNAPAEALELATENWRVQKEPLDARIALEAALAAQQPKAASDVLIWLEKTKLQGDKLAGLASLARPR